MRHERISDGTGVALWEAIGEHAAQADETAAFPRAAFDLLHARGLIGAPPIGAGEIADLLRLLASIGRGDLNVGRIYEGHVNALLLIRQHGSVEQRSSLDAIARNGSLFGVWNTDRPTDPLRNEDGILRGAKNFASGVDGLAVAIVTTPEPAGRRMILVPVERAAVDRSWWRPMGMRASGSHIANFDGVVVDPAWVLGEPDAYVEAPWFQGGAIRFAAVQAGGMQGILDVALAHLRRTERLADPYQRHRIARMAIAVETAFAWLDRAAGAWREADERPGDDSAQRLVAVANATRSVVEAEAMALLDEAERAVGAAGFNAPHPLERRIRDLRTYLRQPNPDGALAALGAAVAAGDWSPGGAAA